MSAPTINYFAYGSNMDAASLAAKGVVARRSTPAVLLDWELVFDISSCFVSEGTVANIRPRRGARVHGVLHRCDATTLRRCDALEGAGLAYQRRRLTVRTYDDEQASAFAYEGLEPYAADEAPTSRRYLTLLLRGARAVGLASSYVDALARAPVLPPSQRPPFRRRGLDRIDRARFHGGDEMTALAGLVFCLADAPARWRSYLNGFAVGEELLGWILGRQPRQHGAPTPSPREYRHLSAWQLDVVDTYLHDLAELAPCVGQLEYARALPFAEEAGT